MFFSFCVGEKFEYDPRYFKISGSTKHPLIEVKSAGCYLLALLVVFGRDIWKSGKYPWNISYLQGGICLHQSAHEKKNLISVFIIVILSISCLSPNEVPGL